MAKQTLVRFLRKLNPTQKLFLLVAVLVFVGLCLVLEKTGVMDTLLEKAGVTDTAALPADGTLEAHFIDVDNADAAFITELSDAGINRTKYSVVLEVTAELYSHSVQAPAAVSVRSVYPIYEGVLEGNVPQYRGVIS